MAGNDISKNTVAILLVIAVIVSVIGTWTTLTQTEVVAPSTNNVGGGVANLGVLAPGETSGTESTANAVLAEDTGGAVLGVTK